MHVLARVVLLAPALAPGMTAPQMRQAIVEKEGEAGAQMYTLTT